MHLFGGIFVVGSTAWDTTSEYLDIVFISVFFLTYMNF